MTFDVIDLKKYFFKTTIKPASLKAIWVNFKILNWKYLYFSIFVYLLS